MSTGSWITSIMSADTLTTPSSLLSLWCVLLGRLDQPARDSQCDGSQICTLLVYISYCMMTSGDVRPTGNRSGITFEYEFRTSWNPPKVYVDLTSPGVVVLDTTVVPDVIGLHAFHEEAALVRVLPGASKNIVRVLVPDDRTALQGFHDLLIEDLADMKVLPASVAGCCSCCAPDWVVDHCPVWAAQYTRIARVATVVQLSPNHVQSDFDVDTEDLYPSFDKSPVSDGD